MHVPSGIPSHMLLRRRKRSTRSSQQSAASNVGRSGGGWHRVYRVNYTLQAVVCSTNQTTPARCCPPGVAPPPPPRIGWNGDANSPTFRYSEAVTSATGPFISHLVDNHSSAPRTKTDASHYDLAFAGIPISLCPRAQCRMDSIAGCQCLRPRTTH